MITESSYHAEYFFYLSPQYRLKKHHKNHQSKFVSKIMILVVNEMK
jgi:hypothetical protein